MTLYGGVHYRDDGLSASIRCMHLQTEIIGMMNDNINGFDKVGYQRKEPVVSSFSSLLGVNGLSVSRDDCVGRLNVSNNPLDISISKKGYFQTELNGKITNTRDGRFKLDKDGNLLTLNDEKVLANNGMPIVLPFSPEKLEDVRINKKGEVRVFNNETRKLDYVATLAVVSADGVAVVEPGVLQGYNEDSNVDMTTEVFNMLSVRKNFEANRQMFILQNSVLINAIGDLKG